MLQTLRVVKLDRHAKEPKKASFGAAGLDLYASKATVIPGSKANKERVAIGRGIVSTGIAIEVPRGCVGRIGSRSGLSVKHNIEVGAGWIDSDYRGEVQIELKNLGYREFAVKPGMRIAQLIVIPIADVRPETVQRLSSTKRGSRRFGSTGIH